MMTKHPQTGESDSSLLAELPLGLTLFSTDNYHSKRKDNLNSKSVCFRMSQPRVRRRCHLWHATDLLLGSTTGDSKARTFMFESFPDLIIYLTNLLYVQSWFFRDNAELYSKLFFWGGMYTEKAFQHFIHNSSLKWYSQQIDWTAWGCCLYNQSLKQDPQNNTGEPEDNEWPGESPPAFQEKPSVKEECSNIHTINITGSLILFHLVKEILDSSAV